MTSLEPSSGDASAPKVFRNGSLTTRKPPPSPLPLLSAQSGLQTTTAVSPAVSLNAPSSSNNTGRYSVDSSRSDELTSLRVSDFPLPPSALPTIPASPRTPRSLKFSTTPRSQSPTNEFGYQQQQSSGASVPSERVGAGSSIGAYELSRDPVPARYSQYAVYKESNIGASASVTATTAGSTAPEWPSSSERGSLQPPRPAYATEAPLLRSNSPLRHATFPGQQGKDQHPQDSVGPRDHSPSSSNHPNTSSQPARTPSPRPRSTSPQPPRDTLPQPPRSVLPVPPRNRDSARYSHIARYAGVTDMGLDVNEEDLLSTDFISEMLNQPAAPSPRSARFHPIPEHPSASFINLDEKSDPDVVDQNKVDVAPPPQGSTTNSQGLTVSEPAAANGLGPSSSALPGLSSVPGADWERRAASGVPSSIYSSGEDQIVQASLSTPAFPMLPDSQYLTASANRVRKHVSPHPLMPSSPMSSESFITAASPRSPHGFAQMRHLPDLQWRNSSTSRSVAEHLPIGGRASSSTEKRVTSPRIRQRHYPRYASVKVEGQTQVDSPLQSPHLHTVNTVQPPTTDKAQGVAQIDNAPQPAVIPPSDVRSPSPSAMSLSSSTRTQHDSAQVSSQVVRTLPPFEGIREESSSENPTIPPHSIHSDEFSTDQAVDDDDSMSYELEGEIQIANRVWGATSSVDTRAPEEVKPTIIGIVPAVILNHNSTDPRDARSIEHSQVPAHHGDRRPGEATPPASPRDPPSIHSPPAHRTDMPESVKSMGLAEDVHNPDESLYSESAYRLPHDEVTGYASSYLGHQLSRSDPQSPGSHLRRRSSGHGTSFKSVISYITNKSLTSVSNLQKSANPQRWTWLKRKPLPPLPFEAQASEPGVASDSMRNYESGLDGGSHAAVSIPHPGEPQGWADHNFAEKARQGWQEDASIVRLPALAFSDSGGKIEIYAEDSLKVTKENKQKDRMRTRASNREKDFGISPSYGNQPRRGISVLQVLADTRTRKYIWPPVLLILFTTAILGIALGTSLSRKHGSSSSSQGCSGNATGVHCNLDATCICPSPQSGACPAPLAKALAQLVPVASQLFTTNITANAMAVVLWEAQGIPVSQNCASQANLVDVGSVLDDTTFPNTTQWAQAALLWSLYQTGGIPATQAMQSAIKMLPFQSLQKDGPQADSANQFAVPSSGYIFNFASHKVEPPPLKYRNVVSPSQVQLSRLNSVAESSLDRMYSYASASSTQRQDALSTYWQSELSLEPNDLPAFISAFKAAPILLPFDATASPGGLAISGLLSAATNRTLSFPPPISCVPALNTSQVQRINAVETQVFSLPSISSASTFDTACFSNRPVYGTLDVLRTRLPFEDSRAEVAKQAVVLTPDASSRALMHVGELLSALPAADNTGVSPFSLDPRQYGTISYINHVALSWLQAFPTIASAANAAKFVLSSPSSPPSPDSTLNNATFIPVVEVAVFGNIYLSDIGAFASSFSTPSGGLFFGSSQGDVFRHWALQQSSQAAITWSPTNFAAQVVLEQSSLDANFERIWSAAGSLISNAPGGITGPSDVAKVTAAFFGS